jgi:hypothetical protein
LPQWGTRRVYFDVGAAAAVNGGWWWWNRYGQVA